jgi:hypothetical protein
MSRSLALVTTALVAVALAAQVWAQPGKSSPAFQGYWMGVDPVDGGDARRSLVQLPNGTFALAARDTAFTLCDGTDRGFGSFEDGEVVGRTVLRSDTLTLECFNNGASVVLHVRYELVDKGLMREVTTRTDGTPVSTIILHKLSEN